MTRDNCPNCGAAITTEKCPFCGAVFYDFAAIDTDKPFYIKIKRGNMITRYKAILTNTLVNYSRQESICYSDNSPVYSGVSLDHAEIVLTMRVVPDKKILAMRVDLDEVNSDARPW